MTAIIFPGQGSQYVLMAKDFHDNFKIARETIEEIEDITSIKLRNIIYKNEDNLLNQTLYTQICIFATSMSIYKTLESEIDLKIKNINYMLGHSLGEYSALTCSEKISLKDASLILVKRGSLMSSSSKNKSTGMAALIGLNVKKIEQLISENNINLQIANDNSPLQTVVSGTIEDLENYKQIFLDNGIKRFVQLNASAAFHSNFMLDAQKELNIEIDKMNFIENNINIISNFDAALSNNNLQIINALKQQMANRVRWVESINNLEKSGETKIIEIGPNKVLSGLIKRISNNFDIKSLNEISDIDSI